MDIITKGIEKIKSVIPTDIKELHHIFKSNGYDLFLVGGCIRDSLLGLEPKDFDVCTNATPEQTLSFLKQHYDDIDYRGEHFGVIVINKDIEIASFRSDGVYVDGRHCDVKVGVTILEDCKRRDFTINALYYDIEKETIIDLVGGVKDLIDKIVRCVGNPTERFTEDRLRIMRAIKFSTRYGFDIAQSTSDAIYANPTLNISRERVYNELKNTFENAKSRNSLVDYLMYTRLMDNIFLGLKITYPNKLDNFYYFLASTLWKNNNIYSIVEDLKFDLNTYNIVDFLINLEKKLQYDDLFQLHRKKEQLGLSDKFILDYYNNNTFVKAFTKFKPVVTGEELLSKGFKGKEIKEEMQKINTEHFKTLL